MIVKYSPVVNRFAVKLKRYCTNLRLDWQEDVGDAKDQHSQPFPV